MPFTRTKADRSRNPRTACLESQLFVALLTVALLAGGCGLKNLGSASIPTEVEDAITTVSDDLVWERYEKIYNESSTLWKRDATLEQSTEILKRVRTQLGKVESRSSASANEQRNSGGPLRGHVFIVAYQTKFENGQGMETFTLVEEGSHWALARYLVTSTALK